MIEIQRLDSKWWRSEHFDFEDKGPSKSGAKTTQFYIYLRKQRSLMGFVKWWSNYRQYAFFPLNSVFLSEGLAEIAQFCEDITALHKSKIPVNIKEKRRQIKARRERIREKYRLKQLTKKREAASINTEVARQIEPVLDTEKNQVVEGGGLAPDVEVNVVIGE